MRTKTLLLTAALGAAGLTSAVAQDTVFSSNAVGFVNVTVPAGGFTTIANPLDAEDNTIGALFTDVPDFTNFLKWSGAGFDTATFIPGVGWDTPGVELAPGEGGFFNSDAEFTVTFVGEVVQGDNIATQYADGFTMVSSQVPQAGTATDLDLSNDVAQFDNVLTWDFDSQGYVTHTKLAAAGDETGLQWDVEPEIAVAEAFFINSTAGGTWTRSFNVNQ